MKFEVKLRHYTLSETLWKCSKNIFYVNDNFCSCLLNFVELIKQFLLVPGFIGVDEMGGNWLIARLTDVGLVPRLELHCFHESMI